MKAVIKYEESYVCIPADKVDLMSTIGGNTLITLKRDDEIVAIANADEIKVVYLSDEKK